MRNKSDTRSYGDYSSYLTHSNVNSSYSYGGYSGKYSSSLTPRTTSTMVTTPKQERNRNVGSDGLPADRKKAQGYREVSERREDGSLRGSSPPRHEWDINGRREDELEQRGRGAGDKQRGSSRNRGGGGSYSPSPLAGGRKSPSPSSQRNLPYEQGYIASVLRENMRGGANNNNTNYTDQITEERSHRSKSPTMSIRKFEHGSEMNKVEDSYGASGTYESGNYSFPDMSTRSEKSAPLSRGRP